MKEENTISYSYNKDTKVYTISYKEMQKINRKLKERFTLKQENKSLQSQLKAKEEIFDEAISYIRDCCNMDSKWVNLHFDYAQNEMSSEQVDALLEILSKGENK